MAALPDRSAPAAAAGGGDGDEHTTPTARHLVAVEPDPPKADPPETNTTSPASTGSAAAEAASQAQAWLRDAFTPDSGLYTDRQPSIAETVRRARDGSQLADTGPLRRLSVAHGYLAAANKAVCTTWVWVVDHPARLSVAAVLFGLAFAFPPVRHVLALLLTPVVWAQQALD